MIYALIFFNVAFSVAFGFSSFFKVKTYAVILPYLMHVVFFGVMPFLYVTMGFVVYYKATDSNIHTYLTSGLIGIVCTYIFSLFVKNKTISNCFEWFFEKCNKSALIKKGYSFKVAFFIVVLYLAGVFSYSDFFYFLGAENSFAAMMALAQQFYFINFVVDGMILFCIYLAYTYSDSNKIFFLNIVFFAALYYVFAQPPTRTWMFCFFGAAVLGVLYPQKRISFKSLFISIIIIPLVVISLQVLNEIRTRGFDEVELDNVFENAFSQLYVNFLQFENANILINHYKDGDYTYFSFLIGAAYPLSPIPSSILPFEKIRADKEAYLTEQLFGEFINPELYAEGSTLTYTIPISGYADFGYLGSAIASALYGYMLSLFFIGIKKGGVSRYISLFKIIGMGAGYRLGSEGFILGLYSFFILNFIFIFYFWLIKTWAPR